ncbi:MAG TPA: Gfo/Idh/MocA family oxidoreductase [Sedimentisphaerales bacterium]|nr:Gfo/Idh/MocA family oxidoreductase [Sedimentisphaerales bacterium]
MSSNISRRNFLKSSTSISIATMLASSGRLFAAGSDKIKIGIIGCGGRGSGAIRDCLSSSQNVELIAMADLFEDKIKTCLNAIQTQDLHEPAANLKDKINVTPEMMFTGFDAYKKILATDIDLVILTTQPAFRPIHLKAAIEAGKHVFMEKPVAVDPVGVRSVIESSKLAKDKNIAIVAGTQRRHQPSYLEIIRRLKDGQIGDVLGGQIYWVGGDVAGWGFFNEPKPEWSEMETQCRNWYFYVWGSGDAIVEQHVHNIDIANWVMGTHPIKAYGMGGRQVRTDPKFGNIWDHFAVEFEYPGGVRIQSFCRQTDGCTENVSERFVGTKGSSYTDGGTNKIEGATSYKYENSDPSPYLLEHRDLIASIRAGNPLNEGERVAESTMAGILGRMSAYTGRAINWDWAMNASKLDLSPAKYEFGPLPVPPVAMPGITKLI